MGFSEGITIEKVEVSCCEEDLSKYCTQDQERRQPLAPRELSLNGSHSCQAS